VPARSARRANGVRCIRTTARRPRVEKIAARGARIGRAKAPGPVAHRMMRVLVPLMLNTMNIEKSAATEQRYTIDWDALVGTELANVT
jgi:hypothetical protein